MWRVLEKSLYEILFDRLYECVQTVLWWGKFEGTKYANFLRHSIPVMRVEHAHSMRTPSMKHQLGWKRWVLWEDSPERCCTVSSPRQSRLFCIWSVVKAALDAWLRWACFAEEMRRWMFVRYGVVASGPSINRYFLIYYGESCCGEKKIDHHDSIELGIMF